MSYRSFKHLLGETSLERKCRFIFGLGILVLVTVSFFWYGQKTESLVHQPDDPDGPDARQRRPDEHPLQVAGQHELRADHRRALGRLEASATTCPTTRPGCSTRTSPRIPNKQPADEFERATLEGFLESARPRTLPPRPATRREVAHLRRRNARSG